jgi:hypothetical protein
MFFFLHTHTRRWRFLITLFNSQHDTELLLPGYRLHPPSILYLLLWFCSSQFFLQYLNIFSNLKQIEFSLCVYITSRSKVFLIVTSPSAIKKLQSFLYICVYAFRIIMSIVIYWNCSHISLYFHQPLRELIPLFRRLGVCYKLYGRLIQIQTLLLFQSPWN